VKSEGKKRAKPHHLTSPDYWRRGWRPGRKEQARRERKNVRERERELSRELIVKVIRWHLYEIYFFSAYE
jgi:hypothetical protein